MSRLTSLFLAPTDPQARPDMESVAEVLSELSVTGPPIGDVLYAAGDGFARQVTFAGCSPYLVMTPPADGSRAFCHVALHGPFAHPRLVTGPNTVKPRCPGCRGRFDDWRDRLAGWQSGEPAICTSCGGSWPAWALDWREHAIGGRVLVELRNVFPGEATPSDLLLRRLEEATGMRWRYAWAGYLDD